MAKVAIGSLEKAAAVSPPPGICGAVESLAYFNRNKDPLHLHLHRIAPGQGLRIGPTDRDCAAYVWEGEVTAGRVALPQGSSLIVEHGASQEVTAGSNGAVLVAFTANGRQAESRAGGRVHLLPNDRVPRYAPQPGAAGASGGLHANAECPTCEVWLHENSMPGMGEENALATAEGGVHSHSEDEIIFVTGGAIRLGTKLHGPGTALAIAADTMYSFTPGPDGLSFINFRAGYPKAFRMKHGGTFDEAGYWRERVSPPEYVG